MTTMTSRLIHSPLRLHRLTRFLRARHASTSAPISDKSRILEKPTRFNPPSHGSRRVTRKIYPGPRLSEEEVTRQKTKRYPNMMPPEGSFMFYFLTDRRLHLWISLSTLTALAVYSFFMSFLTTTPYRDQLPSGSDFFNRPFSALGQFTDVYKRHVAYETELVASKRRKKLEDAQKRKEFLKEHGVEPGFLTGTWMDKFGTVEGDEAKARREGVVEADLQSPVAMQAVGGDGVGVAVASGSGEDGGGQAEEQPRRERKKVKKWLGIW